MGPGSRAYVDAVAAMKDEAMNESHDEPPLDSAPELVTKRGTGNTRPRGIDLLCASQISKRPADQGLQALYITAVRAATA